MHTDTHDELLSRPPLKALALAVVAPFGAIALMATPLAVDALRHALGF